MPDLSATVAALQSLADGEKRWVAQTPKGVEITENWERSTSKFAR